MKAYCEPYPAGWVVLELTWLTEAFLMVSAGTVAASSAKIIEDFIYLFKSFKLINLLHTPKGLSLIHI